MTSTGTPDIDLTPQDWAVVQRILEAHVPQYEVWAFGSRATRTAKKYSDLDLAIITDVPLSLAKVADLEAAFDESDLPIKVDIVDWAATAEYFREIIRRTSIVVKSAEHI